MEYTDMTELASAQYMMHCEEGDNRTMNSVSMTVKAAGLTPYTTRSDLSDTHCAVRQHSVSSLGVGLRGESDNESGAGSDGDAGATLCARGSVSAERRATCDVARPG